MKRLPKLTHMQFLVIDLIGHTHISGNDLREKLKVEGVKLSGHGFHQFMARMEASKFIKGFYNKQVIDGQIIRQRFYFTCESGITSHRHTTNFYKGSAKL